MKNPNWRVITNRSNAQLSTGPKTDAGKAASSQNALRHGLTSKQVVLLGEDPAEYERHRADLLQTLKPVNSVEAELAEELVANSWRLQRAHRVETAVLAEIAAGSPDPHVAIAKSFLQRPKELDRLTRYMTSIERAYWRVFNKLEALQKARWEQERQQAIEQSYVRIMQENQARKQDQVRPKTTGGFVSQPAEAPIAPPVSEPARTVAAGQSIVSA